MSGYQVRPTNPFIEFKKEDIEQSIHGRFEWMVEMYPDRLAVQDESQSLTYRELNQTANRVARAIFAKKGEGNEGVGLLFGNGALRIAAIFGVLKAGKFFILLDAASPTARLRFILENSQTGLIVTDTVHSDSAERLISHEIDLINIDELGESHREDNIGLQIPADAVARISYTSGSTGNPKGCYTSHRNNLHQAMNTTNDYGIGPYDRVSCLHQGWTQDLFGALLNGASVHPFHFHEKGLEALPRWLAKEEISILHMVPTLYRHLVDSMNGENPFPSLRLIILTGETVYRRDVEQFKKRFSPPCLLVNRLGSNEASTVCLNFMDHETQISEKIVPVGFPIQDKEVVLLDDAGHLVAAGGVGEIAVKSHYLTLGYWGQPGLTQSSFQPAPGNDEKRIYRTGDLARFLPDGRLVHLGRKDFQVKVRGYRVEVGEIENALLEMDSIEKAIVHAQKESSGEQRLVAYLVPGSSPPPSVGTLRRGLSKTLSDYMIPFAFVMLQDLPLTATGKVDRGALPKPGKERPELEVPYVAPRTSTEEELHPIWSEVLDLHQIGIHDPFLEMGGDSLRATQIISRVMEEFQVEIPMHTLMQAPTIAEMAEAILNHKTKQINPEEMERLLDEVEKSSSND